MEPIQNTLEKKSKELKSEEEFELSEDSDASEGLEDDNFKEKKVKKEPLPTENNPQLKPRQEIFCQFFAQDRECFGIGVRAYLKAYPDSGYEAAKSSAYHLLTNPHILKRIDELMDVFINDQIVDKELGRVILQSGNYGAKVKAVNEYNKLKGRIIDRKDITSNGKSIVIDPESKAKIDELIDGILNPKPANQSNTGEQRPEEA